jgi:hypothetical protein
MAVRFLVTLVSFATFLALVVPAYASTLEEATGHFVAYQFDGETHHDAPDACTSADSAWSAPLEGSTDGILVAPDDVSDVYLLDVPSERVGMRLQLSLLEPTEYQSLELQAFAPGCAGNVLDPVNWPAPEPSPPAPGPGERQSSLDLPEPRVCDDGRWEFWAEIMPGFEPAQTIHAAWTDGTELTLLLEGTHGTAHAIYGSDHGLDVKAKGAWLNMPDGWQGEFLLQRGPCEATTGQAVYGEPPLAGMGFIDFTPVQAGPHVVQVTYRGSAGEVLTPIPAPATFDPAPYLPYEPSDLVTDPTGVTGELLGHGHEHASDGDSDAAAAPTLPTPSSLLGSLSLEKPAAPDPQGLSVQPPGPIVVPASCHWCGGPAVGEAVKELSYRLLGSLAA